MMKPLLTFFMSMFSFITATHSAHDLVPVAEIALKVETLSVLEKKIKYYEDIVMEDLWFDTEIEEQKLAGLRELYRKIAIQVGDLTAQICEMPYLNGAGIISPLQVVKIFRYAEIQQREVLFRFILGHITGISDENIIQDKIFLIYLSIVLTEFTDEQRELITRRIKTALSQQIHENQDYMIPLKQRLPYTFFVNG